MSVTKVTIRTEVRQRAAESDQRGRSVLGDDDFSLDEAIVEPLVVLDADPIVSMDNPALTIPLSDSRRRNRLFVVRSA